jgi:hypothetical protein
MTYNITARRKASLKWNVKNQDKMNQYAANYRARHSTRLKDLRIKRKYGITIKDFNEMLEKQQGKCAICPHKFDEKIKSQNACIDHNHETGKIRGLLCRTCNRALGLFKDNPEILYNAATYLRSHE